MLLSALVSDVYTGDQTWFNLFLKRHTETNKRLVRYGSILNLEKDTSLTTYTLPSPFLKDHEVEFLEFPAADFTPENDGCHFYIGLNRQQPLVWPELTIFDKDSVTPLAGNEVNTEEALTAIINFIKDKSTVNEYLAALESSNFLTLSRHLSNKLLHREQIFKDLERAVLSNIHQMDDSITSYTRLLQSRTALSKEIQSWSTDAHKELQETVLPTLASFEKKQLSFMKLYTYSESKLELKLREVCDLIKNFQMVDNLNYIKGRLSLPSTNTGIIDMGRMYKRIPVMHKKINSIIYKTFFTLQFPLIMCSVLGVITHQFSVYSMGSLAGLGIVLGIRKVLDNWSKILHQFNTEVSEEIRLNIESQKKEICSQWQDQYMKQERDLRKKVDLLNELAKK